MMRGQALDLTGQRFDHAIEQAKLNTKHGQASRGARTVEYSCWALMLARCRRPSAPEFANYGGRGIVVCERWLVFDNFTADMGPRPSAAHSIDRIDNNGPYSPENCRWATTGEQARNRRTNVWVILEGERMCLADAAAKLGISHQTARYRLAKGHLCAA